MLQYCRQEGLNRQQNPKLNLKQKNSHEILQ